MSISKIDIHDLIKQAAVLFRKYGYHNTSIADIAQACNLSKASVYHHVPGKKELAIEAIKSVHTHFNEAIFSIAYQENIDAQQRLTCILDAVKSFFADRREGCLMGNMVLEITAATRDFESLIQAYFRDWVAAFTHILQSQFDADKASRLAQDAVAQIQGALLMRRLYGDDSYLTYCCAKLTHLLTKQELA